MRFFWLLWTLAVFLVGNRLLLTIQKDLVNKLYIEQAENLTFDQSKRRFITMLVLDYEIEFPEVVLRQFIHETAYGGSKVYLENNNLFGMKESSRYYDIGTKNGHANYKNHVDSIKDYAAWQKRRLKAYRKKYPIKTNEDYYKMLVDCGYAEDKLYIEKLKKINL